jgi:hypothetical protein
MAVMKFFLLSKFVEPFIFFAIPSISLGDDVSKGSSGKAQSKTIFNLASKLKKLNVLNNISWLVILKDLGNYMIEYMLYNLYILPLYA